MRECNNECSISHWDAYSSIVIVQTRVLRRRLVHTMSARICYVSREHAVRDDAACAHYNSYMSYSMSVWGARMLFVRCITRGVVRAFNVRYGAVAQTLFSVYHNNFTVWQRDTASARACRPVRLFHVQQQQQTDGMRCDGTMLCVFLWSSQMSGFLCVVNVMN